MNPRLIFVLWVVVFIDTEKVRCILHGNITVGDDFKYQAFLWNRFGGTCSGVIIDEIHILTAGHCVYNAIADEYLVFVSTSDLGKNPLVLRIKHIYLHPNITLNFIPTTEEFLQQVPCHHENDIAILTLTKRLDLRGAVEAVPLPTNNVSPCLDIEACKIAGWGEFERNCLVPNNLLWMNVMILEDWGCRHHTVPVRHNEFCGIDPRGVSAILSGDSGAGLVCNGVLVGIAIATKAHPRIPAIYVNIYYFLSFITEVQQKGHY